MYAGRGWKIWTVFCVEQHRSCWVHKDGLDSFLFLHSFPGFFLDERVCVINELESRLVLIIIIIYIPSIYTYTARWKMAIVNGIFAFFIFSFPFSSVCLARSNICY